MEPITLITTALVFGATELAKGTLGEAGKQAYKGLKDRISHYFAGNPKAEQALADHEEDPETYEKPLQKVLQQAQADKDEEVLKQAQALLAALDPAGSSAGKYHVQVSGGQGVQVGDRNQQTNTFGTPSKTE